MIVKKSGKIILGAVLTKEEKAALKIEVQKEAAEVLRKSQREFDAIVLWELHKQLDLGPVRLKRFYDGFAPIIDELLTRYEMGDEDIEWLCTKKLFDIGVDIEAWENETMEGREYNVVVR